MKALMDRDPKERYMKVHFLNEQRRMHPVIANMVSKIFYKGRVLTHLSVLHATYPMTNDQRIVWYDIEHKEQQFKKSFFNVKEALAVKLIAENIMQKHPSATVFVTVKVYIILFYFILFIYFFFCSNFSNLHL